MDRYNYERVIKEDIENYLVEQFGSLAAALDQDYEEIEDNLFMEDSVTGNASGSYTFSRWDAEEFICHNMDLYLDACDEFGADPGEGFKRGAEHIDVVIRCYLLSQCLDEVFTKIERMVSGT